jgi:hypothetical protein
LIPIDLGDEEPAGDQDLRAAALQVDASSLVVHHINRVTIVAEPHEVRRHRDVAGPSAF